MKKKLAIIIPIFVIVSIAAILAILYFGSSNKVAVSVATPRDTESSYLCTVSIGGNLDGPKKKQIDEVNKDLNKFYDDFLSEQEKPYFVEAKYENIDNKTVITFKGEVTDKETGKLIEYNKVFTYDFIITKEITNLTNSKYFK